MKRSDQWSPPAHLHVRPYQAEAHDAIIADFETHRSTLCVICTGGGKTSIFARVALTFAPRGKTLVLAHRTELIDQAEAQIHLWTPLDTGVEMADRTCGGRLFRPDVVIASVQSLVNRLDEYEPDAFALIVVDECHHAAAETYKKILRHFASAKVLGVTATPDRGDGDLLAFESIAYVYDVRDAIRDGYLVPIIQKRVMIESLDFSKVRTTAGDLNTGDLDAIMRQERHLFEVAAPIVEHAGDRKTLVFAVTVGHAQQLAAAIGAACGRPELVAPIDGSFSPDARKRLLDRFRSGEIQYLVNCQLLGEGFDLPAISCVALARPTKSRALHSQQIGRGTRLSPDKEDVLVLDFVGNAGRHRLCGTLDVLGGNLEPRLAKAAQELADEGVPVLEAIERAQARLEEEDLKAQERALANERLRGLRAQSRSYLHDVSPQADFDEGAHRGGVSAGQRQFLLSKVGLTSAEIAKFDAGEAGRIIGEQKRRWKAGLSTWKQIKTLKKHGVPTERGRSLTFEQASAAITAISQNGWRAPPNLSAIIEGTGAAVG